MQVSILCFFLVAAHAAGENEQNWGERFISISASGGAAAPAMIRQKNSVVENGKEDNIEKEDEEGEEEEETTLEDMMNWWLDDVSLNATLVNKHTDAKSKQEEKQRLQVYYTEQKYFYAQSKQLRKHSEAQTNQVGKINDTLTKLTDLKDKLLLKEKDDDDEAKKDDDALGQIITEKQQDLNGKDSIDQTKLLNEIRLLQNKKIAAQDKRKADNDACKAKMGDISVARSSMEDLKTTLKKGIASTDDLATAKDKERQGLATDFQKTAFVANIASTTKATTKAPPATASTTAKAPPATATATTKAPTTV